MGEMDQSILSDIDKTQLIIRKYPLEGTNLYKVLCDSQHRLSFHAQLKTYNPLVVFIYRIGVLPLLGVSRTVMLLTTRGRKSGKLRTTPIGYFRIGGVIHLFSAWGKNASWYKNMIAYPMDVWIQIGLHRFPVLAQILEKPPEPWSTIEQFLNESPIQAHYLFGWEPGRDRIERADFSEVIQRVTIIRFIEITR